MDVDVDNRLVQLIMDAVGKLALKAIIISALVVFLSKVAALFPFYMTIVVESFNLANAAAADNYIKQPSYDAALAALCERPLFNRNPGSVTIEVQNADGGRAVGSDNEYDYDGLADKPYRQRGRPLQVTVSALYPFEFTLWGRPVGFDVPVSFSLTVIGLKYYKDLPMDNPYTDGELADITYYDYLFDETD